MGTHLWSSVFGPWSLRAEKISMESDFTTSIAQALAWATDQLRATSDTPRLDAELLLAHVLGWPRARLLAERRHALANAERRAFDVLVERRRALEPVAYLVGHKEFFGLDFVVDRRVLVPRPETELLVEVALERARRWTVDDRRWRPSSQSIVYRPPSIVDVGTGSGCIAIALAVHLPEAEILAVDLSPDALDVAQQNAARHGVVERVRLLQGDLLHPLDESVDLIVSNPPYTILGEIDEGVRRHEPRAALDGGADGLDTYRRLLAAAPVRLRSGGAVLLEIGATQAAAVSELARKYFPGAEVSVYKDLAGLDRVVAIR
jgi:release factor glutamine methyltransferase